VGRSWTSGVAKNEDAGSKHPAAAAAAITVTASVIDGRTVTVGKRRPLSISATLDQTD